MTSGNLFNNLLKCIEFFEKYVILSILCLQLTIKSTSEEKRMKKSYSLLSCFALFLLSLVLFCKPVKAAEPTVINLSDLEEGCTLELNEDSVLNLDTTKKLSKIYSNHDLCIEGSGTLIFEDYSVVIFMSDNAKMVINSGTVISNGVFWGNFVINGGIIKKLSPDSEVGFYSAGYDENLIINGGDIDIHSIYYGNSSNSEVRINDGRLECIGSITSANIIIGENEFVVSPWNEEPRDYFKFDGPQQKYLAGAGKNLLIVPKSEVKFLSGISLNETACTLNPNESMQLSVNYFPEDAINKDVTWSSDNNSIASVDSNGVVKALHPGKTSINAFSKDGSFVASCMITVEDTRTWPDGLVIETSCSIGNGNLNLNQPNIVVKYDGDKLINGADYFVEKEINWDTYISVATITGLDEYIRKIDKK